MSRKANPCEPGDALHVWVKSTSDRFEICQRCGGVRKTGEKEPVKRTRHNRNLEYVDLLMIRWTSEEGNPL